MKVVVIDDSRLSVSALQNIVSRLGHEVVGTAFNGETGLQEVKKSSPDIVCLDFVMPGKDGLETARAVRSENSNIKIIMVTQNELDSGTKGAINASAYVVKPITANKIKEAFEKL